MGGSIEEILNLFQFHEGPIKTYAGDGNTAPLPLFQFHEGPIKTRTGVSCRTP